MKDWNQKWFLSPLFRSVLDTLPKGSSYLDLGCGGGRVALYLRRNKESLVYGLDRDEAQIEELRTLHPSIEWVCANAETGIDLGVKWIVSNVCIRKDQCRLGSVINDQSDYVLRVQGSNDLPGHIDGTLCYSADEVRDIFEGWDCEIITETYQQKFTPAKYLNTSIRKMGLVPVVDTFNAPSIEIAREYLIIKAIKQRQ